MIWSDDGYGLRGAVQAARRRGNRAQSSGPFYYTYNGEHILEVLDHLLLDLALRAREDVHLRLKLAAACAGGHAANGAGARAPDVGGAGEVVGDARLPECDHGGHEGLVLPGPVANHGGGADGWRGDEREKPDGRLGRLWERGEEERKKGVNEG